MPIVNIQGVGQVNFPDTMSHEQIQSAIEKEILPQFPEVQAQAPRGFLGGIKDIGASLTTGLGSTMQIPGQLGELIGFQRTGDLPDQEKTGLQAIGQKLQTIGEEAKSPTLVAKEQLRAREMEKADGFFQEAGTMLRTTATDPALLSSFFAEQLPNFIGSYGIGAIGKGGAKLLMKEATEEALAKVGVRTAIAGNAVMQGTDIGYDTYQSVYKELKKQGMKDDEAQGIALAKGRVAALEAAGISLAATRLPGGASLERAMLGKGLPGTAGFVGSTLGETLSEAVEEGGGAFAKQVGLKEVNPEIDLLKGVGAATALGGLGGAMMGAPAGVVNALRAREEARQPAPAIEPPPPEVTGQIPIEPPAPVETFPPEAIPEAPPVAPPETPAEVPPEVIPEAPKEDPFKDYFKGMPEGSEIIFQNRDRSTPASIAQMQDIASKLDYKRVSQSRDFANGAPVVISDIDLQGSYDRNPDQPVAITGNKDVAILPNGQEVPMMYAVVENGTLLTSNNADGSKRAVYEDPTKPGLRAIAGNGRIAGITKAYTGLETTDIADKYKQDLIADAKNLGINPEVIKNMTAPVLVRVMPKSYLTPDIADLSNRPTAARLSPVETAKNDIRRIDLGGLEFNEDGTASGKTLMQFINAMPVEERTELTDKNGRPTSQANDRLANAIFQKAYGSDALIDLYAQAADPEAKTILNALARVAPKMAQLEGAGEYDVRNALIQAAELAVNARRSGMKLADAAKQLSIDVDPNAGLILDMFANNVRSGKRIGERLNALADEAIKQTESGTDMFGAVPKKPIAEVYQALNAPAEEPGLFDEPPVEAPKAEVKPENEPIDFDIAKPKEKIAKEIDGMTIPELAQWSIDNAPNSAARAVSTKVKKIMDEFATKNMFSEKVHVRNGASRWKSGTRGQTSYAYSPRGTKFKLAFNGIPSNGQADRLTGTNYITILHELLHVATTGELQFIKEDSPIYKDLAKILTKVRKQVREDIAAGKKSPALTRIANGANTIKNPKELVSWGLTDTDFQLYLKDIKVGKKNNLFNELVDVFRRLLGINEEYETALEAVVRATDQILEKPVSDLTAEIGKTGVRFDNEQMQKEAKKQTLLPAFKRWFKGSKIVNEDGSPKIMYHGTSRDISAFKPGQANAIFVTDNPRFAERFSTLSESTKGRVDFESLPWDKEVKVLKQAIKMAKDEGIIRPAKIEYLEDVIAQGELPKDFYITSGISDLIDYVLGAQGGQNIVPVYVKAEKPFDYENPNHLDKLSMYFGDDSVTMEELADGNWSAIEDPQVQEAIQALGFDGFYVMEDGKKNLAVYESNQLKSATGNKGTFAPESEAIDEERILTEATKQTETKPFKRWFGNSKIVNEDGSPKVVYHGTDKPDFNIFNPASWFTDNTIEASAYAQTDLLRNRERLLNKYKLSEDVSPVGKTIPFASVLSDIGDLKPGQYYAEGGFDGPVYKYLGKNKYEILKNVVVDLDTANLNDMTIKLKEGQSKEAEELIKETEEYAKTFEGGEGGRVYPVYLSIKNPLYLDAMQVNTLSERLGKSKEEIKKQVDEWKSQGYDGIITTSDEARFFPEVREAFGEIPNQYIPFDSNQIKSATGNIGTFSPEKMGIDEESLGEKVAAKTKQALQKRTMPEGAFADVDPGLLEIAKPLFYPEQKTIVDKIAGMKGDFWKKVAQGVADQYRAIKDYTEEGYMQARMSKTVDGALEGLTFFGHVFNNKGALDIKKNTKGLMEIMKPIGKEVDRYQMWVALNREAQLPMEKRTKMAGIGELIKRRNEFAAGTIDGKPRVDVYEKVRNDMNALNKSVLKVALDAGLIESSRQKIEDIKSRDYLTTADKEILTRPFRDEIERIENKKAMNVTEEDKQTLKDYRAMIRDINSMEDMVPEIRQELIQYYTDNPGAFERFSADINYIPFYRAMEDGDLQGASTASGLTNQQFSRELKGGERPYGDLMENTLRNWSHILSASMKNQAVDTTMKAAVDFGAALPNLKVQYTLDNDGKVVSRSSGEIVGDGSVKPYMTTSDKGAIKFMVDGQPVYYKVMDPMLMDSISSIGYMGPKSKFLDVARDFKNMLQFGVTVSPAFKVRNLFRDSVSALAVTDLKKNPFANIVDGWAASDRNNPAHISALAGGAIFNFGTAYEGDQSKLIKKLLDQGVGYDTILDSPEKVKKGLTILWEKYKDWGNKSEAANRMALYNQLKEKGYDHLQASFYARDMLDFSMQGSWPAFRLAAQTIPFLNARVQGLYKLGRDGVNPTARVLYNTITGKEIQADDAQKARSFGYTTMAVAMASMLLYMAFKDDEEFKKREQWDRDNFWWIRLPGMDYAFRIPKPFEIGAFGTMAERTLEQIVDSGAEGKAFGDSVFRMLTDTFAMNPVPQMVRPLLDIYANKDAFTGAPIESAGMERLSKQERVSDTTSPIAQALGGMSSILGEKGSLSPVQVDYAIKAYFGWLGGTATQASVYAVQPFRDGAYPDVKVIDKVSQGFIKSLPTEQSRYVTAFYENNKEISQAYADMRHYSEMGDTEKVQKILEEKGDKIALSKMYDKTAKEMAKVRSQIRVITNDPNIDGTTKREMIDRMKQIISMLAEQSESARKALK